MAYLKEPSPCRLDSARSLAVDQPLVGVDIPLVLVDTVVDHMVVAGIAAGHTVVDIVADHRLAAVAGIVVDYNSRKRHGRLVFPITHIPIKSHWAGILFSGLLWPCQKWCNRQVTSLRRRQ